MFLFTTAQTIVLEMDYGQCKETLLCAAVEILWSKKHYGLLKFV